MIPLRYSHGSVIGGDHVKVKKNCQDAYLVKEKKDLMVSFVADGCSNSNFPFETYTEVGSRVGVGIVTNYVVSRLESISKWRWNFYLQNENFWADIQKHTLGEIDSIARGIGGSYHNNIVSYFLFTLVGMIVTPDITLFVGVGDGYYYLNGVKFEMIPDARDNFPTALGYNLIETSLKVMAPDDLKIRVKKVASTNTVNSAMVATDGLKGFFNDSKKCVPGTTEIADPEDFWKNVSYFDNRSNLVGRLNLLASEKRVINWKDERVKIYPPVLTDDLAIVTASRI